MGEVFEWEMRGVGWLVLAQLDDGVFGNLAAVVSTLSFCGMFAALWLDRKRKG